MSVKLQSEKNSQPDIHGLCELLTKQFAKLECENKYAPVKEVLALLGKGAVLTAAILAPKSAKALLPLVQESPDYQAWKRYNLSYLARTLRRLEKDKQVEIVDENGQEVIRLSENGNRRVIKYSLDMLQIEKPKKWDRRWRVVIYDIPTENKSFSEIIREILRTLGFVKIQESVYLCPYPCFKQIEFIRGYYFQSGNILYMTVERIEHDQIYKDYFGLS